jgi:hypothetical protein
MSTFWHMPVSPVTGCSEHSSRATTLRGHFQLVAWRRKLANVRTLGLAAHRMMEAQIIGDLRHQGVEYGIAGEAEDVVGAVVLRPGGLVATVEINRELLAARQFVGTPICHLKCGLHATVAAKFSRLGEFSGLVSLLAPRRRIADQRPTQ